jgi:hypothetical protein
MWRFGQHVPSPLQRTLRELRAVGDSGLVTRGSDEAERVGGAVAALEADLVSAVAGKLDVEIRGERQSAAVGVDIA